MINHIPKPDQASGSEKLAKAFNTTETLIDALNKKEIPAEISDKINTHFSDLSNLSGTDKEMCKAHGKTRSNILKLVEKELGLVPKNHNRNTWMPLGMAIFGISFGTMFSFALGSFAFLGLGFPIGIGIGLAIGAGLDQKAEKEGKQLDYEARF